MSIIFVISGRSGIIVPNIILDDLLNVCKNSKYLKKYTVPLTYLQSVALKTLSQKKL